MYRIIYAFYIYTDKLYILNILFVKFVILRLKIKFYLYAMKTLC